MGDYKQYFKKLNNNKSPGSRKGGGQRMSLGYRSNKVQRPSLVLRGVSILAIMAFCLALYGMVYPESVSELASLKDFPGLKIGFLSKSLAEDGETSAAKAAPKEEKNSPDQKVVIPAEGPTDLPAVTEKSSHVKQLLDKEKEFVEREKRIAEMEEKLQQQKLELDEKIKVLEQARREIASRLETRVVQDQENIEKLVGVYSNMKPQSAAQVIAKLDEELAISILRKMKKQDAGAILNYMDPQKTKVLSEKYSGY